MGLEPQAAPVPAFRAGAVAQRPRAGRVLACASGRSLTAFAAWGRFLFVLLILNPTLLLVIIILILIIFIISIRIITVISANLSHYSSFF